MAITASDIHNQSFSIDRKGYDVDEVDVFLEHVADEIDALNNQIAELQDAADDARFAGFETATIDALGASQDAFAEAPQAPAADDSEKDARIAELERQLEETRADGNAIAQALIIAQRSADDLLARAEQQADEIIAKAHQEAEEIVAKAQEEKAEIQDEMDKLDADCEEMRAAFQDILKGFIGDATAKLGEIGEVSLKNSAHARVRTAATTTAWSPAPAAADQPVAVIEPGVSEPVAADGGQTIATPAVAAPLGKDLSGFGDAAVDDFDFDDLD
ncbi:MAG: DivIVA domain-containing protein [Coriobacteriia bacterium]|nr:DivIVA domain-containing protein [Coriobacteriia bacterium]